MSDQDELGLARKALDGDASALVRLIRTVVRGASGADGLRMEGITALRRSAIASAEKYPSAAAGSLRDADLLEFGRCDIMTGNEDRVNYNNLNRRCTSYKDHPGGCIG